MDIFPFSVVYVGDICPKDTTEVRGPTWVDFLGFFQGDDQERAAGWSFQMFSGVSDQMISIRLLYHWFIIDSYPSLIKDMSHMSLKSLILVFQCVLLNIPIADYFSESACKSSDLKVGYLQFG